MTKINIKFNYFNGEIAKIKGVLHHEIYLQDGDNWAKENEDSIKTPSDLSPSLNKKPKTNYLKIEIKNSKENSIGIFWIERNKIAIVATIKKKTHEPTLKRILNEAKTCLEHAKQNFHANHDTLTSLLNRNGTQKELDRNFPDFLESENNIEDGEQRIKPLESIAILSFDIDNFKQINDTFGHHIGDAVLSAFSKRLSTAVKNLEKIIDSKFILSRPGGEEFELIAIENITRNILEQISNTILEEIRNPSTSIEAEIKIYLENNKIKNQNNIQGIKVLASIGISRKTLSEKISDINEIISSLRQSADTALHRAKKDGKDCARFFEDIRIKHGRLAEFHPHSDLAIIDIGKSVDVKNGDIYCVYYPPFTGEDPFIHDDGRSRKKLGEYIAVESAKIQVVHVQDQLSTCVVIEKYTSHPIPIGSLLKRLTSGTKPRFFSSRQFQTNNGKPENLIKNLDSLIKKKELLSIINLLPNIDTEDFEEKSRLLRKYSSYISMTLPSRTEIFLSADDSMFIIIKSGSYDIAGDAIYDEDGNIELNDDFTSEIRDNINSTLKDLSKHFNFSAGIYLRCDHPSRSEITSEICLHLSKAALHVSVSSLKKLKISYFEANRTILAWRRENNTKDAISDYCAFKKYGIFDLRMENQIGLSILDSEDIDNIELAELALTIANNESPDHIHFWANLGLIKAYMGKFLEAYNLLLNIKNIDAGTNYPTTYRIALAKSALESKKNGELISDEKLLELIVWADENSNLKSTASNYRRWHSELKNYKENFIK